MTFDRFYSIIEPHKAAVFNTMKRAKITIIFIVTFSMFFNIPHLFMTINGGRQCIPMVTGMDKLSGQFYYWFSFIVSFAFPFVSLLIMNSFIINTIGKSSRLQGNLGEGQGHHQGQRQGQTSKLKSSEKQVFAILLLVTFGFLIMTTPSYVFFLYVKFYDYTKSARSFAFYHLFVNVAHKTYYTNYGMNFYLYVISGTKFRADLIQLFRCINSTPKSTSTSSESVTRNSSV